jgi:uncharacterized membrane protein
MKVIILILVVSSLSVLFEVFFNAIARGSELYKKWHGKNQFDISRFVGLDLCGYSSIWVYLFSIIITVIFYGTLLIIPYKAIYIILYVIIGSLIITGIELIMGILLNDKLGKLFGFRIWDYSKEFLNYKGHISFFRSIGWGVLSPILFYIIWSLK